MEFTRSKLSNYILYSHNNVDKLLSTVINESCNAVMLEAYDDKLLLADVNTGKMYLADYNFDGKKIFIENFEPVDILEDDNSLKESVSNYFESDGYDTASIVEAYENNSEAQITELNESIVKGLSKKNNDVADYTQLIGINEELDKEFKDSKLFKTYTKRLEESPVDTIKVITWDKPIVVSIVNEDANLSIFSGSKDKAKKLTKNNEFKKSFVEAIEKLDKEPTVMESLIYDNKDFLALNESEIKEFVGVSIIGNKDLMGNRKNITSKICNIISENEELNDIKNTILEAEEEGSENGEKQELATDEKDIEALQKALDKALETITDEKLVSKINALKDALDLSKDTDSTDVAAVKECIELLSL